MGSQEGEPGLLLPGDRPHLELEACIQLPLEAGAVVGVAHRAGGHRHGSICAELVDCLAVAGGGLVHTRHAGLRQPPALVDELAEPGDVRTALELADPPVRDVCNQQAGGVRSKVDDRESMRVHARRMTAKILTAA
jgi:hypothetical protein